jgi:hypothetical protein
MLRAAPPAASAVQCWGRFLAMDRYSGAGASEPEASQRIGESRCRLLGR